MAAMMKLTTQAELEALYRGNVKEGLHLEYKASKAIDKKDDKKKLEMARDVSAFANADGGQIVYGMTEKDNEPAGLDDGLDPADYPTIWFEQVLQQHVAPSLRGLAIRHVPIAPTTVVVVIDVPATTGDPHQVSDGKYYRRHNFSRLAMEHYEIRDMFRRTTTPDLFVDVSFHGHGEFWVTYRMNEEISQPVPLTLTMGNRSDQLALYCLVMLGIDTNLKILKRGEFEAVTSPPSNDRTWIVHKHSVPHRFPIFKGPTIWMEPVELGLPTNLLGATHQFKITVSTRAPGHMRDEDWYIRQVGGKLRLLPPIR